MFQQNLPNIPLQPAPKTSAQQNYMKKPYSSHLQDKNIALHIQKREIGKCGKQILLLGLLKATDTPPCLSVNQHAPCK